MRWWFYRSKTTEPQRAKDETSEPEVQPLHPATARLLDLQRTVGDQAAQEMIGSSAPETEPPVEEQLPPQLFTQTAETAETNQEARAEGQSVDEALDPEVQQEMGSRFGEDFSDVRIHADEEAARSAVELDAQAYTTNRDIYFAPDKYAPQTTAGAHLLAHELAPLSSRRKAPKAARNANLLPTQKRRPDALLTTSQPVRRWISPSPPLRPERPHACLPIGARI